MSSVNNSGYTALCLASRKGFSECVDMLLKARADVNFVNTENMTPLMEAAYWDHLECVQLLIDAGADVNLKTSKFTPLNTAAFYANHRCVNMLISAGADINLQGSTPALAGAVWNSTVQCQRAFEGAKLEYKPENHNHATCVNLLIQAGADVNLKSKTGKTALIIAASNGLNDCAHLLIGAGASVNEASNDGSAPFTFSCLSRINRMFTQAANSRS